MALVCVAIVPCIMFHNTDKIAEENVNVRGSPWIHPGSSCGKMWDRHLFFNFYFYLGAAGPKIFGEALSLMVTCPISGLALYLGL
jgi:hypothetical protein